ncbi:MAG TPA: DUF6518 family protein [Candidatus Limnocylindrales bacterium]|nr:DUF6518 family protein [Candidatus Limnocylindrales bacterium]
MSVSSAPSAPSAAPSSAADSGTRPSLLRRAGTAIPVALLAGATLGLLAWLSDDLGYPTGLLIPANLVAVWGLVAFGAGAGARTVVGGAGRGLFALLAAVAAYYLVYGLFGEGWRAAGAVRAATIWGSVAILAGPPLGLAGSVWRHRDGIPRSLGIAVPSGLLIAEGLLSQLQLGDDPAARTLLALETAAGVLLPLVAVRGTRYRLIALAAALLAAGVAAAGLLVVLPALRAAADTF